MPKKRLLLISFALNGMLFLMGGLDFIDQGKILFGIIQVAAGLTNLALLALLKKGTKRYFDQLALILNTIVCIVVAIDYFDQGKQYLPFAWILAGVVSLIAFVAVGRKGKTTLRD